VNCRHLIFVAVCARAASAQAPRPICRDSVESRAIACANGVARRAGHTLVLRLRSGREARFIDDTAREADGGYYFNGRLGRSRFLLVESWGHETYPTWSVVNDSTGRRVDGLYEPVVSPDALRFAGTAEGWDNCTEGDGPGLEIWRLTDSVPVRELRWRPWDCSHFAGWGPTAARWRGADTVAFIVRHARSATTRTGVVVRSGVSWRVSAPRP